MPSRLTVAAILGTAARRAESPSPVHWTWTVRPALRAEKGGALHPGTGSAGTDRRSRAAVSPSGAAVEARQRIGPTRTRTTRPGRRHGATRTRPAPDALPAV